MQIGMIGLGRMGANMVRRLVRHGIECVVYDRDDAAVDALRREGARGLGSLAEFATALTPPRAVWLMVPAAAVDGAVDALVGHLDPGDIVVDGGNSHFVDDLPRGARLAERGIRYVDAGVSGGVWGLERGYCLMLGGDADAVRHLDPALRALAPGRGSAPVTGVDAPSGGTAEEGYLHCGPTGAGHFVKMVHNGIEYGMMAALAEGFDLLHHAGAGRASGEADAETAPIAESERYRYEFDLAAIAELWRRGSVISSWLLDLAASALAKDPRLDGFAGRVSDSGEGRWTVQAAVETGTPVPVLAAALFQRFSSRGEGEMAGKLLSALRQEFGGHRERSRDG